MMLVDTLGLGGPSKKLPTTMQKPAKKKKVKKSRKTKKRSS